MAEGLAVKLVEAGGVQFPTGPLLLMLCEDGEVPWWSGVNLVARVTNSFFSSSKLHSLQIGLYTLYIRFMLFFSPPIAKFRFLLPHTLALCFVTLSFLQ